jgi:hypothetical protein
VKELASFFRPEVDQVSVAIVPIAEWERQYENLFLELAAAIKTIIGVLGAIVRVPKGVSEESTTAVAIRGLDARTLDLTGFVVRYPCAFHAGIEEYFAYGSAWSAAAMNSQEPGDYVGKTPDCVILNGRSLSLPTIFTRQDQERGHSP